MFWNETPDFGLEILLVLLGMAGHDSLGFKEVYCGGLLDYNVSARREAMYLELVEKMSKKELRKHINSLLAEAENPGMDRSSRYAQAQFYMRELEHPPRAQAQCL